MYRLFDGKFICDIPLPEVPVIKQEEADIQILRGKGALDDSRFDWFHAWREPDGEIMLSCARQKVFGGAPSYLLRFPDLVDFLVNGSVVSYYPLPDCREDTLRHLVLDQVIPRVWAHLGHLVLHASAVQLADGRVIAFMGDSGWGKSTLAGALQARGCRLLSDDCIGLEADGERVRLTPSYTGLRLNEDSITTLGMQKCAWAAVSHYSGKQRLLPVTAECNEPLWLDTLYIMVNPGGSTALSIKELAGAELITTLIKRSFLLDVNDDYCGTRQMREAGSVLRLTPGIYGLDYPRDYNQLTAICDVLSGEASP